MTKTADSLPPAQGSPEDENYFTCNLGQSALYGNNVNFTGISQFVQQQAQAHPALPAFGYFTPGIHPSAYEVLDFEDIHKQSGSYADSISEQGIPKGQVVALMVRNLPDFLLVFLALIKIGSPVLLIAPQCSLKASAQLCKQCNASILFQQDTAQETFGSYEKAASEIDYRIQCYRLAIRTNGITPRELSFEEKPDTTAYLFHTSGTSTGIPKPIPQTHKAGAGVQHRFDGTESATFTTTPLYHGGMADLFRAWTSNALIWLFPGEHLPITQKNVVKCLDVARQAVTEKGLPPVKYFSSVPYVLQAMSSESEGLEHLLKMDIVGVGGAALATEVGDDLVRKGVKLISRFGSAECGFLMSSHRDYANDLEWRYLRPKEGKKHLRFEPRDNGLHELIVLPTWPFMAKSNQKDGSFATSDLFELHPDKADAWRYDSRADSQLTLVTGKKFDPAPVESAVAASSSLIGDVLVFGNEQPLPGALIFRSSSSSDFSNEKLLSEIWPAIEKLNSESQSHARIPRNMLVLMPFDEGCLEKSSKGTIIRRKAEERYGQQIEQAYAGSLEHKDISDGEVAEHIRDIIQSTMGSQRRQSDTLDDQTDLFAYGVDSIASIQIRNKLRGLLPKDAVAMPATIVEDCGTIEQLSEAMINLRHGETNDGQVGTQLEAMEQLVTEYSVLSKPSATPAAPITRRIEQDKKTILLTGSTGSLGCNLLSQLLSSEKIQHIHLLVRGANPEASRQRLVRAMASRQLSIPPDLDSRVTIHPYVLSEDRLGLRKDVYARLAQDVDLIIHLAWSVNFLMPLRGFRQHFYGLQTLLNLALAHSQYCEGGKGARLVFCSSTASVASFGDLHRGAPIPEEVVTDPKMSGSIGYSRSKWVAEAICSEVSKLSPELKGLVDIVRVGQVSGHSETGVWNVSEAYPLLLSSARLTGCLPKLDQEQLAWIPVDKAATAFVQLAIGERHETTESTRVFHLLNPERKTDWNALVSWIHQGETFDTVPVEKWLRKLESLRDSGVESERNHPCLKLLDFWKRAYGAAVFDCELQSSTSELDDGCDSCEYSMAKSKQNMPVLASLSPLEEEYVCRLWNWTKNNI